MRKNSKCNLAVLSGMALVLGVARAGGDVQTGAGTTPRQRQDQSAAGRYAIRQTGDRIVLSAGVLEKTLEVAGGKLTGKGLAVEGAPLLAADSDEVSLRIARAEPDRNPLEVTTAGGHAIHVKEDQADGTDALAVDTRKDSKDTRQVAWKDELALAGKTWQGCFNLSNAAICSPAPGVSRLIVRVRSLADPLLAGVSINVIFEIHAGHPAIRKWVEIRNNGSHWLRLSDLVTDDLQLAPAFRNQTLLTPSERGAGASIVAFSHTDERRGLIVASEIPSALRLIQPSGASGYNPEHFEWILGPAETFESEPTSVFAFSGDIIQTPSARSLPLDRAVEDGFQQFLKHVLGISPAQQEIPAPQWATWSNFGPEVTDAIVREQAGIAARCGFALFELDDGWQRGRLGKDPDLQRFPDLCQTSQYIRSLGLRLGLWVSCYRDRDADDFKALPDAASVPEKGRVNGLAMSFASPWRHYLANDLLLLHDLYGATYFKQDFTNIKFGDLAAGHDSRTRKESLLRGLRGLLESQAVIRRLAPDIANQVTHEIYWGTPGVPCDLAVLKVATLYHIPPNDYSGVGHWKKRVGAGDEWASYDPVTLRAQLVNGCFNARNRFYAHRGLPLECIEYYGAATVNWKGSLTAAVQDRQVCSWLMGAPLVFSGDLASLSGENIKHYRQRFDLVKRLQRAYGIYRHSQFSGVPAPTDTDWHWWGKLNAAGRGAVVVIRGSAGSEEQVVNLPWVRPDKNYSVSALFGGNPPLRYSGKELQDGALKLKLPKLGQEILELNW
jgi:hypothetical protein